MSGESPTTAGSIVGKLKLDKSEWDRQRAEAKGEAAELGATKATIKVDASIGEALTKMEAVRAAQQKLDFSTQNLKIAYQRLDEVQSKGGASQSRLMALHLAASKAEAAHEAATRGLANAQTKLAQDSDDASTHVRKLGNAVQEADKAMSNSGGSGGGVSRFALIAGAIAALIPLLAPLAGYAAAVGGALAGMGAAGILAIFGVKNAMEDGTAVGYQYSAGITELSLAFHQLASTAATATMAGFSTSIEVAMSALPQLNSQIAMFGKQLGGTTVSLVRAVIDGFRILNPLFVQAGAYVQQLAAGFQQWVSGGGLQKFTQMAVAALPQVADALGNLLKGVLDVVGALAPLGSIMLTVVGILGQFLSVIAPILANMSPLAAVIGVVWGAFALWRGISPIVESVRASVRGFGIDVSTMLGVAGLAVTVISYLASAMITQRMAASEAAQALQNYTAAVEQDNGVIGKNVQLQAAKWAADKNALGNYTTMTKSAVDVGKELGLGAQTITNASLGQRQAIKAVAQAMQDYANSSDHSTAKVAALRAEFNNLVGGMIDNEKQIKGQVKAYNDVASAQGLTTISTKAQFQAQRELAASYGLSVSEMLGVEAAQKQNADQAAATTHQLQMESDAATLLKNAFDLLNGTNLGVAQAQTMAAAATNSLTDALSKNGTEIDGNSKAAISNQQALQQKAAADQQAAEAIANQTGSTVQGTAAFAASREALIAQLTATGQLTPAIQALIDKYYAIPPVVKTKVDMDADAALKRAQELKAWLDSLTSKTVVVTVQTNAVGAPVGTGSAPGTGNKKYADGGTVLGPGGPRADSVGAWLSAGEEVTPNPQAGKYRPVLKALARDDLAGASRAMGGGRAAVTAQAAPVFHFTITSKGGIDLSKYIDVRAQAVSDASHAQFGQQLDGGLV